MEFYKLAQLLFDRQLLASGVMVRSLLTQHEIAMKHGHEYVGVVKKDTSRTEFDSSIFNGNDGSLIGVVPIKGSLVYEESEWGSICGLTSYEGLQREITHMVKEKGIEHLILDINSGGGMAYGCFEAAQFVRDLATEHGVKITSYVDGSACSGGYAWCCIADEVIMNPMARVGSIGVVLPLVNTSERDKKDGVQRVYITAGKSKVPYDKDGNYTEEALTDIQKDVMVTYNMFVDHVKENRSALSREDIIDTEAKVFGAEKALQLGLVDSVKTKEQFYEHLGNFNGERRMSLINKDGAKVEVEQSNSLVMTQLSAQIQTLEAAKQVDAEMINTLTASRDQAVSDLAKANEELVKANAALVSSQEAVAQVVLASRKDAIAALVSVDDVEDHMSFVADFDDAKFAKYKDNLAVQSEKISASFTAQGADAPNAEVAEKTAEERTAERYRQRHGRA